MLQTLPYGGGCCNDRCSLDTSKGGGLGKFATRRERSVSKRKISVIVSGHVQRIDMLRSLKLGALP